MYVQCKNYFLGKTTNERFSRRAPVTSTTVITNSLIEEVPSSSNKIQEEATENLL
jgi:hypothetical protein